MKLTQEHVNKGQELYQELVTKAWESATFKEQLMNNPEEAIAEVTGNQNFHSEYDIVVEDQTDTDFVYLNIPRRVSVDDIELSEDQLEQVSGGIIPFIAVGITLCVIAYNGYKDAQQH